MPIIIIIIIITATTIRTIMTIIYETKKGGPKDSFSVVGREIKMWYLPKI